MRPRDAIRLARVTLVALAACAAPAHAETLDGITIVHLADDDAAHAIHGARTGNDRYLVLYVSGRGSYASLGTHQKRHCLAWAKDGSYTGTAITFGVPATNASIEAGYPYVCQPFEVQMEGDGMVRLRAANPVGPGGPLGADAQVVDYSRRHRVVARAPLIGIDWSQPMFRTYTLHDVPLGPWAAVTAALAPGAKMSLSPLEVTYAGARKKFVVDQTPKDIMNSRRVMGDVLAGERLQWPWDALYGARLVERFEQRSTIAAFDAAIQQRFGTPTLTEQPTGSARRDHYWLFDLQGRQISQEHVAADACLATKDLWDTQSRLSRIHEDVGPWNCGLVVRVRDEASVNGTVTGYELEVMNGYAAALNHFTWRVEETLGLREALQATADREVEL